MEKMKKMKKGLAVGLVLTMCMTVLAGCGGDKKAAAPAENGGDKKTATGDTIKIGGLAPLTGDVAIYGIANKNGAELAFKEINAAKGVLGKKVEFNTQDEKGDEMEAINAYNKLVSDGVVAILGDVTSKPCAAVAETSVADNMPMVTATGTASVVTTYGDNLFRVCFIDPFQGKTMATFAADNLKAKTAAVLYNVSSDYSDGLTKAFKETAEAKGMKVLVTESYGDTDKDFKTQLSKVVAAKPDVLFIPDYYKNVALIANQAKEIGCTATLLGADGWDGVVDVLNADSMNVVEGAYFCNHYSVEDPSAKVQGFIKNYKAAYNNETPNAFAALAYDAAYILADAINKAGSTDKAAIIKALQNTTYEGVTGKITFDKQGDPIKSVSIIKIVNGKYTFDSSVTPDVAPAK